MARKLGDLVLTGFFGAVDAGMEGLFGGPSVPKLRRDPDSEEKERALQESERDWAKQHADAVASGRYAARPQLTGIYFQWYGRVSPYSGEDTWNDDRVLIELPRRRVYESSALLRRNGDHARGEGALGLGILLSPVFLLVSPIGFGRRWYYQAAERRRGMSRHAIAFFERLKSQLDVKDEALLASALKNDWLFEQKMARSVSYDEALIHLSHSRLKIRRFGTPSLHPHGTARYWIDDQDDCIASMVVVEQARNPPVLEIMGSRFTGDEALRATSYFREIDDRDSDD
ncbi:MAG: hypothetical protein QY323_02075 [Patescibacteria group bacterium]|nr:MAG: hypothetical protein QY323_02075 [Patescibacteria group bacterium]